jgi:hypothetical protein
MPSSAIFFIQPGLSDRVNKLIILDMGLLSFLQEALSGKSPHSAQDLYFLSAQHLRTLHQPALVLAAQPGHLLRMYAPQAPQ